MSLSSQPASKQASKPARTQPQQRASIQQCTELHQAVLTNNNNRDELLLTLRTGQMQQLVFQHTKFAPVSQCHSHPVRQLPCIQFILVYHTYNPQVAINGANLPLSTLKQIMGFVPQDDIVHEDLTVRWVQLWPPGTLQHGTQMLMASWDMQEGWCPENMHAWLCA